MINEEGRLDKGGLLRFSYLNYSSVQYILTAVNSFYFTTIILAVYTLVPICSFNT